ncbi:MAG: hypothetical protein DYH14_00140 [Betaproteobacteria bacterium PRO3]|nr:hypothetical protein [Betaproteobacteria bacterium PRO3]
MTSPRCDPHAFFEAIGRDPAALASTLELFRTEGTAQCARIVSAVRTRSRRQLREALHAFAGSLAIVRAKSALDLCEILRRRADDDGAALELAALELEREFERVCEELSPFVARGRAAA